MASKHSRCPTLTLRQKRFVEEFLRDLNGTQAAIRAGYSPKTAEVQSSENLRIPKVQEALAAAMAQRSQRTQVAVDGILREIALLAYSDVSDFIIDDRGDVSLRPGAPPGAMRAVQSLRKKIHHTESGICYDTELRLHPKATVLRMAAEHLGLLLPAQTAAPTTVTVLVNYAPTPPQEVPSMPPTTSVELAPCIEYTPASQGG
jgi:phage terminase small subunit